MGGLDTEKEEAEGGEWVGSGGGGGGGWRGGASRN